MAAFRVELLDRENGATAAGKPRGFRFLLLGLCALLIGCLITGLANTRYQEPGQPARTRVSSEISQTRTPSLPTPSLRTLSLQAKRDGADLRVSWDRNTAAVAHAQSGVLQIRDGDSKQDLRLDAVQLRSRSVVYTPVSNSVQFRLEVSDANGQSASEWLLVLAAPLVQEPSVVAAKRSASRQLLTAALSSTPASYAVQVGSFRNRANAERLSAEMQALFGPSRLVLREGNPPLWRVLVGNEATKESAGMLGQRIQADLMSGQRGHSRFEARISTGCCTSVATPLDRRLSSAR
jgi:cell division septation protein DedD